MAASAQAYLRALDDGRDTLPHFLKLTDLGQLLSDLDEFLGEQADADQPAGCDYPIPNEAMRLHMAVQKALDVLERAQVAMAVRRVA